MRDQGLRARATHLALPALAGGFALALLITADAGADSVTIGDLSEPSLASYVDLIGAQYANDLDGFSARVTVRDLKPRTTTIRFALTFPKSGQVYRVTATRTKAGAQTAAVHRVRDDRAKATCADVVVSWDDTADRIDVHVPWSCLGDLRAGMKVQALLDAGKGVDADPADVAPRAKVPYN